METSEATASVETRDTCSAPRGFCGSSVSKPADASWSFGGGGFVPHKWFSRINRKRCENRGNSQAKQGLFASVYRGGDFQNIFESLFGENSRRVSRNK